MKRPKRRPGERGAALFVVVLIVVLLTAIGAFAAHATSLTQAAAGYARRAGSTFYIGEFGTNLVLSDLAGKEDDYLKKAFSGGNDCRANAGMVLPAGVVPGCRVIEAAELAKALDSTITGDADGPVFGALSRPDRPAEQTVRASYRVEMTDIALSGETVPGANVTDKVWSAALTVTARLLPTTTATSECTEDASRASETQSFRGYVVFTTKDSPPTGALPP